MSTIGLLIAFQVKHFICDYPLQTTKIAMGKGSPDPRVWVPLLALHAGLHGLGAALVMLAAVSWQAALLCGLADALVHFAVDRVKASKALGGRWAPNQSQFWWALGADQMAHHLTGFALLAACGIL